MICNATYDSLEAVPEALRDEFENKNGRWQLKDDAVPGVGALFNPGLVANAERAIDQAKKKGAKIQELETKISEMESQLAAQNQPGSVVLSKEDAATLEKYSKLGSPKDLEKKLSEFEDLRKQASIFSLKESLEKLTKEVGDLNADVLTDWASAQDGLEFFVKDVETTDAKGVKKTQKVAFARVQTQEGNKTVEKEVELLPYAKEKLPEWKYLALTQKFDQKKNEPATSPFVNSQPVILPNSGSASGSGNAGSAGERLVDKFNAERSSKPNPFQPAAAASK